MNLPATLLMGGRTIDVIVTEELITKADGKKVVGMFRPLTNAITVCNAHGKDDIAGEAFVHELCEAADVIYDLKLPHQTIQTLSAALYQALSSGEVSFAKAA